ncbi:MAG: FtsX-like permease family protein [candidate division WOR-3 bacterium]
MISKLIKLAYRNFRRNTRRSIISGISIAIAVTLIIFTQSYIKGFTQNISDNIIKLLSGHIRITTKEYERRERLLPLSEAIDLTPEFYEVVQAEAVKFIAPRIKFGVLLGKDELSIPALGYAIDPIIERQISGLDKRIISGSYLDSATNATIIGKELARRLNLTVGDTLTLVTRTAYDSPTGINLVVRGIFSIGIGGIDRSLFYIPLSVGQKLLDLNEKATEVALVLKKTDQTKPISARLRTKLDYSIVPFQYNSLLRYINAFTIVYYLIYAIILIVACSTIANTMIMVVFERTREIGMMKAMGFSNRSVVGLLLLEATIIGVIGSFIGTVIGAGISYWLKIKGLDFSKISSTASTDLPFGPIIHFQPSFTTLISTFVMGIIFTVLVAYLAVRRTVRLDPAQALKTI